MRSRRQVVGLGLAGLQCPDAVAIYDHIAAHILPGLHAVDLAGELPKAQQVLLDQSQCYRTALVGDRDRRCRGVRIAVDTVGSRVHHVANFHFVVAGSDKSGGAQHLRGDQLLIHVKITGHSGHVGRQAQQPLAVEGGAYRRRFATHDGNRQIQRRRGPELGLGAEQVHMQGARAGGDGEIGARARRDGWQGHSFHRRLAGDILPGRPGFDVAGEPGVALEVSERRFQRQGEHFGLAHHHIGFAGLAINKDVAETGGGIGDVLDLNEVRHTGCDGQARCVDLPGDRHAVHIKIAQQRRWREGYVQATGRPVFLGTGRSRRLGPGRPGWHNQEQDDYPKP